MSALQAAPTVRAQMLIRRPVREVFEAFVDPKVTTRFWFTRSSGKLEAGRELLWEWEMYGASAPVLVEAVEPHSRILIAWGQPPTPVEWLFSPRGAGATLVRISSEGASGAAEEVVAAALDSMGGFTMVLAGLKALLEHGIELDLVTDHHPDALVTSAADTAPTG